MRIVFRWQQRRDRGIFRNGFQLIEHGDQMGQQSNRRGRFEMFTNNVPFRICVTARAGFRHVHFLVKIAQNVNDVNRGFCERVEHFQYEMTPLFLKRQRKPHFCNEETQHHRLLVVEVARKIKSTVGRDEIARVLMLGHAVFKIGRRYNVSGSVCAGFNAHAVAMHFQKPFALFPSRARRVRVQQRHSIMHVGWVVIQRPLGPNVYHRFNEATGSFGQMKRFHTGRVVQCIEKCGMHFNHFVKRSRQRSQFADRVNFGVGYCRVNKFKRVGVFFYGVPSIFAALFDLFLHFAQMRAQGVRNDPFLRGFVAARNFKQGVRICITLFKRMNR